MTTAMGWVNPDANIIVTIVNLLTGSKLEFFSNPDGLADNVAVAFEADEIRGRSSQYFGYNTTGPRTTSLDLPIHEDYLIGYNDITQFTNKVKALAYPEYAGQVIPPRCYLRVGKSLRGIILVNTVNITWSRPIREKKYINGTVTIDCTVLQPIAPTASDIEGGMY